jgi:tellurite resistance protein
MNYSSRIKYFPVSSFSIVLGLSGLTIAFQKVVDFFDFPLDLNKYFLSSTVIVFILLSVMFMLKLIKYTDEVKKDFRNPVKLNFFPTISVSLLLLSIAFLSSSMFISKSLWILGTIVHTLFTYKIISIWTLHPKFDIKHFNPAWFIPVVGNMLIPVVGVVHFNPEISWFFYSIGLLFWIVLFSIFIYRIIFHHPLPEKLLPTLAILIAPPAVGFTAYVKLTHEIDSFAKVLYYFAMFLTTFLLSEYKMFSKIKFYLSWWAYSFPIASMSIASILMYHMTGIFIFKIIAIVLVTIVSLIVLMLISKTIIAIKNHELCVKEE